MAVGDIQNFVMRVGGGGTATGRPSSRDKPAGNGSRKVRVFSSAELL